jgi:hypothetical protein
VLWLSPSCVLPINEQHRNGVGLVRGLDVLRGLDYSHTDSFKRAEASSNLAFSEPKRITNKSRMRRPEEVLLLDLILPLHRFHPQESSHR